MSERLDHIERPTLPWRDDGRKTECGLPIADHPVIGRDDFIVKVKRQGQQRAALSTCMTCWTTARRWDTWDHDPVGALRREVGHYSRDTDVIRAELRAIAALVDAHRDEFDALLAGIKGTVRLDDLRRERQLRGGR